jgi:hypothetical protein
MNPRKRHFTIARRSEVRVWRYNGRASIAISFST